MRTLSRWSAGVATGLFAMACTNTPSWYTQTTPNRQAPSSIVVTGPSPIAPNAATTYTLTITYPNPLHATANFTVKAEIYEDDWGDVLLDRVVRVSIPAGATSGSATFTLTCLDPNMDQQYVIQGDNGSNTYDDVWEIFGYVPDQVTSESDEGPNLNVICEEP